MMYYDLMRKYRKIVHLTRRQEKWLKEEAAKLDISVSEKLRRIIDDEIARNEKM